MSDTAKQNIMTERDALIAQVAQAREALRVREYNAFASAAAADRILSDPDPSARLRAVQAEAWRRGHKDGQWSATHQDVDPARCPYPVEESAAGYRREPLRDAPTVTDLGKAVNEWTAVLRSGQPSAESLIDGPEQVVLTTTTYPFEDVVTALLTTKGSPFAREVMDRAAREIHRLRAVRGAETLTDDEAAMWTNNPGLVEWLKRHRIRLVRDVKETP